MNFDEIILRVGIFFIGFWIGFGLMAISNELAKGRKDE